MCCDYNLSQSSIVRLIFEQSSFSCIIEKLKTPTDDNLLEDEKKGKKEVMSTCMSIEIFPPSYDDQVKYWGLVWGFLSVRAGVV